MNNAAQWLLEFLTNALWQAPVVMLTAVLLAYWARRSSVDLEHRVWVMAVSACLLLPMVSVMLVAKTAAPAAATQSAAVMVADPNATDAVMMAPANMVQRDDAAMDASTESANNAPEISDAIPVTQVAPIPMWKTMLQAGVQTLLRGYTRTVTLSERWIEWLAAVYLGWLLFGMSRLAWMWRRTVQMAARATDAELTGEQMETWQECQRVFGLEEVKLLESDEVSGPVTVGCMQPVLMVPPDFLKLREVTEMRAAMCHELAHIQRKDFLMNLMYEAVMVLLAWHPAAQWMKRRLDESREMACDEMAAARLESRGKYAAALLRLAETIHMDRNQHSAEACALGLFETGNLERRVMNLLRRKLAMSMKRKIVFTAGCALAITLSAGAALACHLQVVPKVLQEKTLAMLAVAQETGISTPPTEAAPAATPAPAAAPAASVAASPDAPPAGGTPNSPDAPPSPRYTPNSPDAPPAPRVAPVAPVAPYVRGYSRSDGQQYEVPSAETIKAYEAEAKARAEQMKALMEQARAKSLMSADTQRQLAEVQRAIKINGEMAVNVNMQAVNAAMMNARIAMAMDSHPMMFADTSGHVTAEGGFEKTLTVSGDVVVDANSGSGNVRVHAGADNQVHVVAKVKVYGEGGQEKLQKIIANPPIEQNGNKVVIGRTHDNYELYRNVGIDYEITMPKGGTLSANSGSGNVEAEGVRHVASLNSGSGNVTASGVDGSVRLNTGSGNIKLVGNHADGEINANSGSGNVELQLQGASVVKANSGSGNVTVDGLHGTLRANTGSGNVTVNGVPTGKWEANTPSGNVRLHIEGNAGYTLSAHTMSGNVNVAESQHVDGTVKRTMVEGTVRGGGVQIDAHTISGDVSVE